MRTSELTGAALDWAVAKCEDWVIGTTDEDLISFVLENSPEEMQFRPSTNWAQGGLIIERQEISINWANGQWVADTVNDLDIYEQVETGSTPLTAAMRCYVVLQLGDEVDVPEELL